MADIQRVVAWYSCGVTSAVAAKLTIERYRDQYPVVVAYCDTGSEHPDNQRFLADCANWFDMPITVLQNPKYSDIYAVFEQTRFMSGRFGARCSLELKKMVRRDFEDLHHDLQVFGFDVNETRRAKRFQENNPEVSVVFPLIEAGLTKADCLRTVQEAGIELPMMYRMGYKNNNCIGCVKGQVGYWNKIRQDFPEVFERTAKLSREIGCRLVMHKGEHIFLDEIQPEWGNYKSDLPIECGLFCGEI